MSGMTVIVKTVTRLVKILVLIFGINITLTGHLTPGGGFAGGVIIAYLYLLLTLAYGKKFSLKMFPKKLASSLDSIGALIFLITALLGFSYGGAFFVNFIQKLFPGKNFALLSAGTIPLNNIAICLKVAASLFLAFIVLSVLRIEESRDKTKNYIQEIEEE